MARIVEGKISEKWDQVYDLIHENWQELVSLKPIMRLSPQIDRYKALEDAGLLLALFAYDSNETIIGYSANIISNHIHFSHLVTCSNDVLFLTKSHRKGRAGMQLILETEKKAKERGARLMLWHAKPETDLAFLLPRIGYGTEELLMRKELF